MARHIYTQDQLRSIFSEKIKKGAPHQWQKHTIDKASLYRAIMTGIGQEEYIVEIKDNETKVQKDRRIRFHHPRTKSIANGIRVSFNELSSVDNIIDISKYATDKDSKKLEQLMEVLSCFDDSGNAKEYITRRITDLNFFDSNAFIVFEHEDGYAYPIERYSDQIFDFEYKFGALQYLITKVKIIQGESKIDRYYLRAPGFAIKAEKRQDKESFDVYEEYQTETTITPAIRVGFRKDPETNNATAVGILEPATEEFKALMWTGSELDLHKKNHYFLQKFIYAPECGHQETCDEGLDCCIGGVMSLTQKKCPAGCESGYAVHLTNSDVIKIRTPNSQEEKILGLDERVHYVEVPGGLVDGIKTDAHEFESRIVRSVFNAELLSKAEVAETATAKMIELRNRYVVYSELGRVISKGIMMAVQMAAEYNGISGDLINEHRFPVDFKLETVDDLVSLRASMVSANVPHDSIKLIDERINKLMNRDNTQEVLRHESRERFRPFRHLNMSERITYVATLNNDHPDKILYTYFNDIMDDVEFDLIDKDDNFHNLPRNEQKKLVQEKTNEYAEEKVVKKPEPQPVLL